ncbi:hypothetical protein [Streptomyces celluloflavus]
MRNLGTGTTAGRRTPTGRGSHPGLLPVLLALRDPDAAELDDDEESAAD